jgi:hypothetical protein
MKYEITFIDSGVTEIWTRRKAIRYFGRLEFNEILEGYHPSIVAVKIENTTRGKNNE